MSAVEPFSGQARKVGEGVVAFAPPPPPAAPMQNQNLVGRRVALHEPCCLNKWLSIVPIIGSALFAYNNYKINAYLANLRPDQINDRVDALVIKKGIANRHEWSVIFTMGVAVVGMFIATNPLLFIACLIVGAVAGIASLYAQKHRERVQVQLRQAQFQQARNNVVLWNNVLDIAHQIQNAF